MIWRIVILVGLTFSACSSGPAVLSTADDTSDADVAESQDPVVETPVADDSAPTQFGADVVSSPMLAALADVLAEHEGQPIRRDHFYLANGDGRARHSGAERNPFFVIDVRLWRDDDGSHVIEVQFNNERASGGGQCGTYSSGMFVERPDELLEFREGEYPTVEGNGFGVGGDAVECGSIEAVDFAELFTAPFELVDFSADGFSVITADGATNIFRVWDDENPPAEPSVAPPSLSGPPTFSPSDDLVFSGLWTLVSMWDGDHAIDLVAYGDHRPNLGIRGRQVSGDDGCNNHGGGLFYATADGQLNIRGGTTTNMGCVDPIHELYQQGALGADRWGRTADDNLVLTNGTVVTEFALTEALPPETPHGLSAPLNTIWMSDVLHDYDNFEKANAPATLTFTVVDDTDIATLRIAGCGDIPFDAVFGADAEGPITFTLLEEPNLPACDVAPEANMAFEALARADYFAASFGGILLWDGPTPVAIFADE